MDLTSLDGELDQLRTIPVPPRPPVEALVAMARRRRRRRTVAKAVAGTVMIAATGLGLVARSGEGDSRVASNGPASPSTSERAPAAGDTVVPDVVGWTVLSAVAAMRDAGLVLSISDGDAEMNDAVILAVEPGIGTAVKREAVVGARTALPDPPVEVECPDARHPRGEAGADALPRVDGLDRRAAAIEVDGLRQQVPETSATEIYLGIWDRWAYSEAGTAIVVAPAKGFQVIVVGEDASRCPSAPQFRGVPVTYVTGPVEAWAGGATATTAAQERARAAANAQRALANSFVAFAASAELAHPEQVPLADRVRLGLGTEIKVELDISELVDRSAWELDLDGFKARSGLTSALDLIREGDVSVTVGDHTGCVGVPSPRPSDLADLTRISLQPTTSASCLDWFAVDLFTDPVGKVVAVTVDLYEP